MSTIRFYRSPSSTAYALSKQDAGTITKFRIKDDKVVRFGNMRAGWRNVSLG